MKNVLTLLLLTTFIGSGFSQSFIDKYYQDLVDAENSTVVSVSGDMFRYAAVLVDESTEDELQTKDVLNGIKSLQFLGIDETINPEVEYQKGIRTIPENMTELVSVKSKESRLKVFIDEVDEVVYEIIAIGIDDESFFVGSILCDIKLEDINEVLKQIQKHDNKAFKQLKNLKIDELNVYPNPVSSSGSITIEIPKSLQGGSGILLDGSGRSIKEFKISNSEEQLDLDNLTPGNYILSIVKDEIQLKKKILIVN